VLLGLLLVSCSVSSPGVERGAASPQALLDALAAAERDGDTVAVRALIDPAAPTSFVSAELARTANLRAVPLSEWRYRLDGDPAAGGIVDATLEYAITGADTEFARRPLQVDLVQKGSTWLLGGLADRPGARTYRGPWDFGRIASTKGGDRAIVLAHPAWERLSGDVARMLPAATEDVVTAVGGDWQGNVVVFLAASEGEYVALGGTKGNAATTVSDSREAGQRIVLSPGARSKLDRAELGVVLRHELVHVATRARTVDQTPLWVTEGFADWVAYGGAGQVEAQDGDFPDDAAFAGRDANRAYASARSVFAYANETCGGRRAVGLFDALAAGTPVADAIADVCGVSEVDFRDSWREWTLHT
jgi:hypothetical protein